MKKLPIWPAGVLFFLHVLTDLSFSNLALAQQQPAGVVTGLQGQAQLTRQAAPSPLPLRFKDGVIIRDIIDTREKSLARILFGGRSTVTVRELTRLVVREEILPTGARRDVHELSSGAILVNVARQLMRPGDEVIIRTPNAVASVRGSTIFCQCFIVPALLCKFALLFGSATVTPDGQQPVTLTPNTGLNITGTGPTAEVTLITITQDEADQILADSQVGKIITEEANRQQIAETHTQTAAELAAAVVEAVVDAALAAETNGGQQPGRPEPDKGPYRDQDPGGKKSNPQVDQQVVVKNETRTLKGDETLKTFSGEDTWTGNYPVVEITNSTVNRASTGNLIQVDPAANVTLDGKLLQVTDSTITDSRVLEVSGSLKNTSPETLITIDPSTVNTPGDFITVGPEGSLSVEGPLLKLTDSTVDAGGALLHVEGGSLTSTSQDPLLNIDPSTVSTSGDFILIDSGGSISLEGAGGLLIDSGGTLSAGGNFLAITDGGTLTSNTTSALLQFENTNLTVAGHLVSVSGGTMTLGGPILSLTGAPTIDIGGDVLHIASTVTGPSSGTLFPVGAGSLTASGNFLELGAGSTLNVSDSFLTVSGTGSVEVANVLNLGASLTTPSGKPLLEVTAGQLSATSSLATLGANLTLQGTFLKQSGGEVSAGADALAVGVNTLSSGTAPVFNLTGGTITVSGEGSDLVSVSGGTITLGGSIVNAANATFDVGGRFLNVRNSTFTGDGTDPLIILDGTTVTTGLGFVLFDDSSQVNLKTPVLKNTGRTYTIGRGLLGISDGAKVNVTTTADAAIQLSGSTVNTSSSTMSLSSLTAQLPPELSISGPLFSATNETKITASNPDEGAEDLLFVADSAKLTGPPKPAVGDAPALISFDNSSLESTGPFLGLRRSLTPGTPTTVELGGPLLKATGSTFDVDSTFIAISESAELKGTGTTALIQSNPSTFNIGGNFLTINDASGGGVVNPGTPGSAKVTLDGPFLKDTGSTFNITNRFVNIGGGSTLSSTTTDSFIQFSGSEVITGNDFLRIDGSGSKITLSGSFLSAGSTLNIGTDPTVNGDVVVVREGGQLVMNSSNPVVLFTGGTHTVGTDDATANDTPNRLFRLSGVNTDGTTGLGTDQPIKGNGVDPAPFAGASNPTGSLLKATDGATIEVKKGSGDTVGGGITAGNALRLDTALLEAALPIINLIGSGTAQTKLTTAGDAMEMTLSKVVSLGPVVALDKGLINVTNGALITLRNGSNLNVTGDLLSLISGSKINVVNGPLIRVTGTLPTGTSSSLNVSGALVNFGGTGGNQIIVNNNIAFTANRGGPLNDQFPVNIGGGGAAITIGANPVKNPALGNITINGTGGAGTGVLIQATSGGKVNITAP